MSRFQKFTPIFVNFGARAEIFFPKCAILNYLSFKVFAEVSRFEIEEIEPFKAEYP